MKFDGGLALNMKKGGWSLNRLNKCNNEIIFWDGDSIDDALLMISLFIIQDEKILKKAEEFFKKEITLHGLNTGDTALILPENLKELYELNKKFLSQLNIKIVGAFLGCWREETHYMKEPFLEKMEEYDIQNFECIESTSGSFQGKKYVFPVDYPNPEEGY